MFPRPYAIWLLRDLPSTLPGWAQGAVPTEPSHWGYVCQQRMKATIVLTNKRSRDIVERAYLQRTAAENMCPYGIYPPFVYCAVYCIATPRTAAMPSLSPCLHTARMSRGSSSSRESVSSPDGGVPPQTLSPPRSVPVPLLAPLWTLSPSLSFRRPSTEASSA